MPLHSPKENGVALASRIEVQMCSKKKRCKTDGKNFLAVFFVKLTDECPSWREDPPKTEGVCQWTCQRCGLDSPLHSRTRRDGISKRKAHTVYIYSTSDHQERPAPSRGIRIYSQWVPSENVGKTSLISLMMRPRRTRL